MTIGGLVRYELSDRAACPDAVATLTLDSASNRNALSNGLIDQLLAHLDTAVSDPRVRVILLRGSGPSFCSGADLKEVLADGMYGAARKLGQLQRAMLIAPKPVIVRAQGHVRAGGLGLVASADVAVGADTSTFALSEARLGLAPAVISVPVMNRMTSRSASERFLTGQVFSGEEAARFGLLSSAVAESALDEAVEAIVEELLQGHPQGLRETKRILNRQLIRDVEDGMASMVELSEQLFASEAAKQQMDRFLAGSRNRK